MLGLERMRADRAIAVIVGLVGTIIAGTIGAACIDLWNNTPGPGHADASIEGGSSSTDGGPLVTSVPDAWATVAGLSGVSTLVHKQQRLFRRLLRTFLEFGRWILCQRSLLWVRGVVGGLRVRGLLHGQHVRRVPARRCGSLLLSQELHERGRL